MCGPDGGNRDSGEERSVNRTRRRSYCIDSAYDPRLCNVVRDGLVSSLQHPGGNLTGGHGLIVEMQSKLLEFAMELMPRIRRIDVIFDKEDPSDVTDVQTLRFPQSNLA